VQPIIYSSDLPLDKNLVDRDALQVIHRLKQAGFMAYLVGGGVRDLLLNRIPKDFDISTSAPPPLWT
jgi:poly(A) polymerase